MNKDLMTKTPKALATKAKINNWDLIKEFPHSKISHLQSKQPTEYDKFFAIYSSDNKLISKIYK